MKKTFFIISMLVLALQLIAQEVTTKTKMIYAGIGYEMYSEKAYSSSGTLLTDLITLKASNDKYTYLHDIIKLCVFEPNDMMSFFDYSIKFLESNDDGTSKTYKEMSLSTQKKKLFITVSNGYFRFKKNDLLNLQKECRQFIEKQSKI